MLVSHNAVNIEGLSDNLFWPKSEALLMEPDPVAKAPGFDGYFVRHSTYKNSQPHLVTFGINIKVTCKDCVTYKGLKIRPTLFVSQRKWKCLKKVFGLKAEIEIK